MAGGTLIRLDSKRLKRTLAEGKSDEKLELLEWIYQEMDSWDIFPVRLVLPCLRDADCRVCCVTIRILSSLAGDCKLCREGLRDLWSMLGHPDSSVRETLVEMFQRTRFALQRSDLVELLPLMRHRDEDVRSSAVRLFLEVPYFLDKKLCVEIADSALREDLHIQATVYELLAGVGQEHLLESGEFKKTDQ